MISCIELYNISNTNLDISGYTIYDTKNWGLRVPNHTVPAGTILPPGGVLVVFGGGNPTPGNFGGAIVQTSTFGDLGMTSSGDLITLDDAAGIGAAFFDISKFPLYPNESYTRNPDGTGTFEQHNDNTPLLFSPGLKVDGTPFNTTYLIDSLSVQGTGGATAITTPGATLKMLATAFPQNDLTTAVSWSTMSANGAGTINSNGTLTARANGIVTVIATATDGTGTTGFADVTISGQNAPVDDLFTQKSAMLYPKSSH